MLTEKGGWPRRGRVWTSLLTMLDILNVETILISISEEFKIYGAEERDVLKQYYYRDKRKKNLLLTNQ